MGKKSRERNLGTTTRQRIDHAKRINGINTQVGSEEAIKNLSSVCS